MSDEHAARIAETWPCCGKRCCVCHPDVSRLALIRASQVGVVQPDETVLFLLERLTAVEAELTAERARHAPLRARIKEIQDQHDQETGRLHAEINRHKGCDEFWSETNMNNYRRWKQAAADLVQVRQCSAAWKAAATAHRLGEIDLLASVCAMQGVLNDIRTAAGMVDGVDIVVGTVALRQERDQARQALSTLRDAFITHRTSTHELDRNNSKRCVTCAESDAAIVTAGEMLAGHQQAARDDGAGTWVLRPHPSHSGEGDLISIIVDLVSK